MSAEPAALPPFRRRLVLFLLGLSLACNVAALMLPFMNLRIAFKTEPYSLLSSATMMWHKGLYVLAALVIAFSVVFPFAKLATLICVASGTTLGPVRQSILRFVERLGKWSMLDVFLVCLILTLTSGQLMVGSEPLIGMPLFVVAILLSMTSGELLTATLPHEDAEAHAKPPLSAGFWLLLSALALAGTLGLPFLRIDDWKLSDHTYSVITLVPTLWKEDSHISAVIVALFLIVTPILAWLASARWWWCRRADLPAPLSHARAKLMRRWSMLDVFGLALAIFLVEGEYLMKTEVRWGALFLVAMLALQKAFQFALDRALTKPA
ncbi:MAG TPA: paraquat-inducible protein A [Rariglobus sp.]|nr:paraquat-inducible protein A [Rariglobus sp.]